MEHEQNSEMFEAYINHGSSHSHGEMYPHGIMIGDVGNIYYFVCKKCGENTIEPYWDSS